MERIIEVLIPFVIIIASIIYQVKKGANEKKPVIRKKIKPRSQGSKPEPAENSGGLRNLLNEIEEAISPTDVIVQKPAPKKPAKKKAKKTVQQPVQQPQVTTAPAQVPLTPLSSISGQPVSQHPMAKIQSLIKDNPKGMIILHEILSKPKGLE